MCTQPPPAIVVIVNPLVLYLVFVGIAVALSLSAMVMTRPMVRCCPGCNADVRLDAQACRACGYTFT
jgi:ribosomal protein L40E